MQVGDTVRFADGRECEVRELDGEWVTLKGKFGFEQLVREDLADQGVEVIEAETK